MSFLNTADLELRPRSEWSSKGTPCRLSSLSEELQQLSPRAGLATESAAIWKNSLQLPARIYFHLMS